MPHRIGKTFLSQTEESLLHCLDRTREAQRHLERALALLGTPSERLSPRLLAFERFRQSLTSPEGPQMPDVMLACCEKRLRELERLPPDSDKRPLGACALLEDLAASLRGVSRILDKLATEGQTDLAAPPENGPFPEPL